MLLKKGAPILRIHQIFSYCLWLTSFILFSYICNAEKIRYASLTDCDRHSLDALYHEKYKLVTNNIFADTKEFASRVMDLVADSLTTIMSQLPDRDVSDDSEKKVFMQFQNIKSGFISKVKKMQRNITKSWESLIVSNFNLMYDNEKSSLEDYLNKTINMTESYTAARQLLDSTMAAFVKLVKATVNDGMSGITAASKEAIKKEAEERKKNGTEGSMKKEDDVLHEKMVEVAKMIVPGFLGKVSLGVIERKMDLTKDPGIKPENRDSVLDDIYFDMMMVNNRIRAITYSDIPRDKGAVDLARRSIFTYWADMAEEMYKDKIRTSKSKNKSNTGRMYYRNFWRNEDELVETLLNLMEVFP